MGALMMALAALAFSSMHTMVKHVSVNTGDEGMHAFEIAFFRIFFGFVALAPIFLREGWAPLKTTKLKLFAWRGGINAVAMLMFFYGLTITPLATAAALGFTAPIFATLLAMAVLGEVVRVRRLTAIAVGFAGALVILRPGVVEIGLGPLLVLGSSIVWACALMIIKILTRTESSVTITAYASIFLSPICLIAALPYWVWPDLEQLAWLFAIGVAGTIAQTSMNQALKLADASAVLPVDFTKLIWAALLGFLIFAEIPDAWTWIGGAMIFASATYIGIRESRLKKQGAIADTPPSTAVDRAPPIPDKRAD